MAVTHLLFKSEFLRQSHFILWWISFAADDVSVDTLTSFNVQYFLFYSKKNNISYFKVDG